MSDYAPYLGYLAAILGTICWIPQARQAWISRDTRGLSLVANLMVLATVTSWLIYGILLQDLPIILANSCAALIVSSIIVAKLKFG